MAGYRKRERIHFDDYDGDVVMGQTPSQKGDNHFTHSPSGLQDRDELSQAYKQIWYS